MIELELERSYFKVLEDGTSEFEYVVGQLIPHNRKGDYDLGEYMSAYTDGSQLILTNWDNDNTVIWL